MALRFPTPGEFLKIILVGLLVVLPFACVGALIIKKQRVEVREKQNESVLVNPLILEETNIIIDESVKD